VLVFTLSEIVFFSIHSVIGQMDKSQKYIKPMPLFNTTNSWNPFFLPFTWIFDRHLII